MLSILVHALAVGALVEFRGSIEEPGVDSKFINVVPVAVFASLAIALPGALIAGLPIGRHLVVGSILAGLVTAAAFLATDTLEDNRMARHFRPSGIYRKDVTPPHDPLVILREYYDLNQEFVCDLGQSLALRTTLLCFASGRTA